MSDHGNAQTWESILQELRNTKLAVCLKYLNKPPHTCPPKKAYQKTSHYQKAIWMMPQDEIAPVLLRRYFLMLKSSFPGSLQNRADISRCDFCANSSAESSFDAIGRKGIQNVKNWFVSIGVILTSLCQLVSYIPGLFKKMQSWKTNKFVSEAANKI